MRREEFSQYYSLKSIHGNGYQSVAQSDLAMALFVSVSKRPAPTGALSL